MCAGCVVFLVSLDFLHSEVDQASLDYYPWIVFSAFAWAIHRPLDFWALESWVVETLEDGVNCLIGVAALATSRDDYETWDSAVGTALSSVSWVDACESSCSSD